MCTKVIQWNNNKQCDLMWWKSEWIYNNDDLKIYITTAWY